MTTDMLFQIWNLTTVLPCHLLNTVETSPLFVLWANDFTTFLFMFYYFNFELFFSLMSKNKMIVNKIISKG